MDIAIMYILWWHLQILNIVFSGSLTITEFVLFSMVILEDSCMLDIYVDDILNIILKKNYTRAVDEL